MPLEKVILDPMTRRSVPFSFTCRNILYTDDFGRFVLLGRRFPGKKGDGVVLATWAIEALQSLETADENKQVCLENQEQGWTWHGLLKELPQKEALPSSDPIRHGPSPIVIFDRGELDPSGWDYLAPADGELRFANPWPRKDGFFKENPFSAVVETAAPASTVPSIDLSGAATALSSIEASFTDRTIKFQGKLPLDLPAFLRANQRNANWLPNVKDLTALAKAQGYTITIDEKGFRAYKHG